MSGRIDGSVDLIHIDGGHGQDLAELDLRNAINISNKLGTNFILVDDANAFHIRHVISKFIFDGSFISEDLFGEWEPDLQTLSRIIPLQGVLR